MRNEDKRPITTFRSSQHLKKLMDRKVTEVVLQKSTIDNLYKYTRTDLILDSIKNWIGYSDIQEPTEEKVNE
jgi:hypothetical protein